MELTGQQIRDAVVETIVAIDPGVEVGSPQYDIVCDSWYVPLRRVAELVSLLVLTRTLCEDHFGERRREEEWLARAKQCLRELTPGQKLPGE